MSIKINNSSQNISKNLNRINKIDKYDKEKYSKENKSQATDKIEIRNVNSDELINFLSDVEKNILKDIFGSYSKSKPNKIIDKFRLNKSQNDISLFKGNKLNTTI